MERNDVAIADDLMLAWVSQVIRRQRGEASGLRAISWTHTGYASTCCAAPPVLTRKQRVVCAACWQDNGWRSWSVPRAQSGRGDGITTMVVHESRSVRRDLEQSLRVAEADRFVHLAAIVEPRPRALRETIWHRDLLCLGSLLRYGTDRAVAWARFLAAGSRIGGFSPRTFWNSVSEAREVLAQRARRDRHRAELAVGRLAA